MTERAMSTGVRADGHAACGARRLRTGLPCTQRSGWGTPHPGIGRCKNHGGSTPTQIKAAEIERVERETRLQFGKLVEIRPVDNPLEVYRGFAGRVMAWLETLDAVVTDLKDMRYRARSGEQLRAEVAVFERAMDRANTVLATYARLGIDDRLAGIEEAKAAMVIAAIDAALRHAGVVGAAAADAKRVAASHLRVIEGTVV